MGDMVPKKKKKKRPRTKTRKPTTRDPAVNEHVTMHRRKWRVLEVTYFGREGLFSPRARCRIVLERSC